MRLLIEGARHRLKRAAAALCVVAAFGLPVAASAEVKEVQIARGFAIPHLPIMIMEHDKLLEKHALAAGLGDIRVTYSTIGGGSVMNDSLISGALSFGVGGPPPMLTLWDKTRSGIRVKGVCAEATMPLLLNTRNPNLKTVKDLTRSLWARLKSPSRPASCRWLPPRHSVTPNSPASMRSLSA